MFLYHPSQILRSGCLVIPYEIRAALGWHEGIPVHITATELENMSSVGNELVLCPIPLASRADLWHFAALFRDRVGLIAELSSLLTALHLDIVSVRATTRQQSRTLAVKMNIDARLYHSKFDQDSTARNRNPALRLDELESRLIALFAEDLEFRNDNKVPLRIDRHRQLRESAESMRRRESTALRGGVVNISAGLISEIRKRAAELWPHLEHSQARPRAFLIAEPIVSILRVVIYWPNTGYLHVRVAAANRVGTVAAITKELRKSHFNILQMYTRNIASSDRSVTDLLLALTSDTPKNDAALRLAVKKTFRSGDLKTSDVQVTFPPTFKKPTLAGAKINMRKR